MEEEFPVETDPAEADLWQQDLTAEELPDAISAFGSFSTFASISSIGVCIASASCVGSLSCS